MCVCVCLCVCVFVCVCVCVCVFVCVYSGPPLIRLPLGNGKYSSIRGVANLFISPPNIYLTNTGLVPGVTGGYYACLCQRAL